MDIMSLILKRLEYNNPQSNYDEWLMEAMASNEDEVCFIVPDRELNLAQQETATQFHRQYHLKAMFHLNRPYGGAFRHFILYVFTKNNSCNIQYGIFHTPLIPPQSRSMRFKLSNRLPDSFFAYLRNIEAYLDTDICPESTDDYEFGRLSSDDLVPGYWNPRRYSKAAMAARAQLKNETTLPLKEIAQIIRPRPVASDMEYPTVDPRTWSYPADVRKCRLGQKTDCPLQKGDIVYHNTQYIFMIYDDFGEELHAVPSGYIIRPRHSDFCPEYLYLYLRGRLAQTIMESTENSSVRRTDLNALMELPVIIPDQSKQHYQYTFYSENFPHSYFDPNSPIFGGMQLTGKSRPKAAEGAVFISYSTRDTAIAEQTRHMLETNGIPCWMAPASIPPGSDYGMEIPNAIGNCQVLLLILSQASQESNWVPKEVGQAIGKGKTIVPFQIDDSAISNAFDFYLTNSQRISAYNRLSLAYQELVKRLSDILN